MATEPSDLGNCSLEVCSSQVTLGCVQLTIKTYSWDIFFQRTMTWYNFKLLLKIISLRENNCAQVLGQFMLLSLVCLAKSGSPPRPLEQQLFQAHWELSLSNVSLIFTCISRIHCTCHGVLKSFWDIFPLRMFLLLLCVCCSEPFLLTTEDSLYLLHVVW